MRFVRHLEDPDGNLVEILYYCSEACYRADADHDDVAGGWWPCLDVELRYPEPCRICGEPIGRDPGPDVDAELHALPTSVASRSAASSS